MFFSYIKIILYHNANLSEFTFTLKKKIYTSIKKNINDEKNCIILSKGFKWNKITRTLGSKHIKGEGAHKSKCNSI